MVLDANGAGSRGNAGDAIDGIGGQHRASEVQIFAFAGAPQDGFGAADLHVAACARSAGLPLVSNSLGEFEPAPGLLMENWGSDLP